MKGLSIRKMILLVILLMAAGICLLLGIKVQQVTCGNVYILSFLQEGKGDDLSWENVNTDI